MTGALEAGPRKGIVQRDIRLTNIFPDAVCDKILDFWLAKLPPDRGKLQSTNKYYHRAIMLDGTYAEAHYDLAGAYEGYPTTTRLRPKISGLLTRIFKFYPAYNSHSQLYILRRREYGPALRLLDRALELKPQEPSVQYSLHKNFG